MAFRELRNLLPALMAVSFGAYKVSPPSAKLTTTHSTGNIIGFFDEIPASALNTSMASPSQIHGNATVGQGMFGNIFFEMLDVLIVGLFEVPLFRQLLAAVFLWVVHLILRVARGLIPASYLYHLAYLLTGQSYSAQQQQLALMGQQLLFTSTSHNQLHQQFQDFQRTSTQTQLQLQDQISERDTAADSAARTAAGKIERLADQRDGAEERVRQKLDPTGEWSNLRLDLVVRKIREQTTGRAFAAEVALSDERQRHQTTKHERSQAVTRCDRLERERRLQRHGFDTQEIELESENRGLDTEQETTGAAGERDVARNLAVELDQEEAVEDLQMGQDTQAEPTEQVLSQSPDTELQEKVSRLEAAAETLRSEAQTSRDEVQAEREQAEGLSKTNVELERKLSAMSDEKKSREDQLSQNNAQLEEELAGLRDEENRRKDAEEKTGELERQLTTMTDETKRREEELSQENAQLGEELAGLRDEERKRKDAEEKTSDLEREVSSLREENEKMESEKQEKIQSENQEKEVKEQLERKLAALEDNQKENERRHSEALMAKEKEAADKVEEARQAGREEAAGAMQSTSATEDDLQAIQEQLRVARDAAQASDARANDVTLQAQQLQQQLLTSQGQLQGLLNERADVNARFSLSERTLASWQMAYNQQNTHLQNAQASIETLQTRHNDVVGDLQGRLNDHHATICSKDAELAELRAAKMGPETQALANDKARLLSLLDSVAGAGSNVFVDDTNFVVSALVRAERYLGAELKDDGDDLRAVIEDQASDIAWELVNNDINSKAIDATPIRRLIQDPSKWELVRQALAINWTLAQYAMYLNDFGFNDETKKAVVGQLLVAPRETEDLDAWIQRYDAVNPPAAPASAYPDLGSLQDNADNGPYYNQPSDQTSALPAASSSSASMAPNEPSVDFDPSNLDPALSDPTAATTAGVANPPSSDTDDPFKNEPTADELADQAIAVQTAGGPLLPGSRSNVNLFPTGPAPSTQVAQTTAGQAGAGSQAATSQKRKAVDSGEVDFPNQAVASKKVGGDLSGASRVPNLPPGDPPDTSA